MPAIVVPGRSAKGARPFHGFSLNRDSPQARGLLGWWPLTEGGGLAREYIASRNGTYENNPAWQGNPSAGFAPKLDGTTADIAADYRAFDLSQSFSISCWFFCTGGNNTYRNLASHRRNNAASAGEYAFLIGDGAAGNALYIVIVDSGIAFRSNAAGGTAIQLNTLYHAIGVFDAENDEARTYLNGRIDVRTTGFTYTMSAAAAMTFRIGAASTGVIESLVDLFPGAIWDVRLYNRALTDQDAWMLYDAETRWDLYWMPHRVVTVAPVTASSGLSPFLAGMV